MGGTHWTGELLMDKKQSIDFIQELLVLNEEKKSEEKLTRKDIVEILINDYHVSESTAYRYYVDAQNEYLWQQEKSGNPVQRNKRQEVLDNIWDIALNARTEKDDEKYLRTIERWSKLSTLFKKA